jgi:hypothetical protein
MMTDLISDPIKRLQNGSIDYSHYSSLGHELRNCCLRGFLRRLLGWRPKFSGFRTALPDLYPARPGEHVTRYQGT